MCKVRTNILYKTKGDLIPSKSTPSPLLGKIRRKKIEEGNEKERRKNRERGKKREMENSKEKLGEDKKGESMFGVFGVLSRFLLGAFRRSICGPIKLQSGQHVLFL